MNRSRQVAVEIFNDLDRRLKSTDKKDIIGEEPEVRDRGPQQHREKQKTKRKGNRPPDNKSVGFTDVHH